MKKIINLYKKNEEIVNYLIVGGLTTIVAIGSKFFLLFTILNPKSGVQLQVAEIISWILAVTFAYLCNRIFVFKSTVSGKEKIQEIFNFFKGRVATQILQMIIMWFFVTLLKFNSNKMVVFMSLICQIMQIILNYIISKFFVFKKEKI